MPSTCVFPFITHDRPPSFCGWLGMLNFNLPATQESIGSGGFGKVIRARKISTMQDVALKIIDKGLMLNEKKKDQLKSELDVFIASNHPFIVNLRRVCLTFFLDSDMSVFLFYVFRISFL